MIRPRTTAPTASSTGEKSQVLPEGTFLTDIEAADFLRHRRGGDPGGGLPLAYEVLPGNTADNTNLRDFLARIERQYGKARRIWLMDRGIPTEVVLAEMRGADPPVQYLVGTPKAA